MAVALLIGKSLFFTNMSARQTLLRLPLELQQDIAAKLDNEALLSFRLLCKELEAASFDSFADQYLHLHCAVYSQERWLRLEQMLSSRLGPSIRSVTLTYDLLECKTFHDISVPENDSRTIGGAALRLSRTQHKAACSMRNDESTAGRRPSHAQMVRTFRRIKIHGCRLVLDFGPHRFNICQPPGHYVFWAACAGNANAEVLTIAPSACEALEYVLSTYPQELPEMLRTVQRVSIMPAWRIDESELLHYVPRDQDRLTIAQRSSYLASASLVLRSSQQPQELTIESFLCMDEHSSLHASSVLLAESRMLSAANFTHLRSLSLVRITLRLNDLLHALISCQSSLVAFRLSTVSLEQSSGSWIQVWRQLTKMPQVRIFELGIIMQTVQFVQHLVALVQDFAPGLRRWKRKFSTMRAVQNELERLIVFHQGLQNM